MCTAVTNDHQASVMHDRPGFLPVHTQQWHLSSLIVQGLHDIAF